MTEVIGETWRAKPLRQEEVPRHPVHGGVCRGEVVRVVRAIVVFGGLLSQMPMRSVVVFARTIVFLEALMLTGAAPGLAFNSSSSDQASFLSTEEREVVREMNLVRANPSAYAQRLEKYKAYYKGNLLSLPGHSTVATVEGVHALDEAITSLREEKPAPPLSASPGMSLAAREHQRDLAHSGSTSHTGSDGSDVGTRLGRHGWIGYIAGENISFGETDARQVVFDLIVDDGVPDRGHRKNILNRAFRTVGVACGSHARWGTTCVIDYTNMFKERDSGQEARRPLRR